MKRAFVRGLWGIYSDENRLVKRRYKMDSDIKKTIKNRKTPPFVTYVFGQDNYEYLKRLGLKDVRLLNESPNPYDLTRTQYRHKLEILKYAMEDFDEIVFVDWDCVSKKPIPSDFWKVMNEKEVVQANLQQYKRRKCFWRGKVDTRKLPNAGFLYMRDKSFPDKILKFWEKKKGNSAEPPLAQAMDEMTGGWVGKEKYWDLFEPEFCNLWKYSAFGNEQEWKQKLRAKRVHFIHYQGKPSDPSNKAAKDAAKRKEQ